MRILPISQQPTAAESPEGDSLSGLRDIHLPAEPSWWPPAPGWWIVVILLILSFWVIHKIVTNWRTRNQPYRALLAHTRALRQKDCDIHSVGEISELLRRVAVMRFGRQRVAKLHGEEWLNFLNHVSGGTPFAGPVAAILSHGIYRAVYAGNNQGFDISGKLLPSLKDDLLDAVDGWARAVFRNTKETDQRLERGETQP